MDTSRLDHLSNLIEGGLRIKNRQGLDAKSQEFLDGLMEEFNFLATMEKLPYTYRI